jgi:molybdopterin-containing oxidoreductase family membrane subunit
MMDMSTTEPLGIVGIFKYLDDTCLAIEKIKGREDFKGHEVFSPTSYHEIEHASGFGASPVRWFTLIGALLGVTAGFAMPLLMDWDWPIVVGGKTAGIYSLPAYFIFGFELMILFGAIATIKGMLWFGKLPDPKKKIIDPRTTDDLFAIYVPGASIDGPQATLLKECGAIEINPTT